jgi:hypothetical protein
VSKGHLFVVRGKIGRMVADAAIISTDQNFTVEPHWFEVLAVEDEESARRHRPEDWRDRSWGQSSTGNPLWFLNVTSEVMDGQDRFDRLADVLADIARTGPTVTVKGRPMPLVVLPMIGTEGGGLSRRRGEVVSRLLDVCQEFVDGQAIDVAIAAPNAAAYAALQHSRRVDPERGFFEQDFYVIRDLAERARNGSLALFLGAGTSIPAGAPSWDDLIKGLAEKARLSEAVRSSLAKLSPLDQAELLQHRLGSEGLATHLQEVIGSKTKPALAHVLLAALNCQSAVTTNYDVLYEVAVESSGEPPARVLPLEVAESSNRWILKMHGDLRIPDSVVLTRGESVGFTAASGPSGAVLQSLLLTRHLLVVGTSMTDDNLLRLIHEVAAFRRRYREGGQEPERFGTILDVSDDAARRELHSRHFRWQDMPGAELPERARQLEIFLDAVVMEATVDHSWLLDPAFEHLHSKDHRPLAARARDLAGEVRATATDGDAWSALAGELERFGAPKRD